MTTLFRNTIIPILFTSCIIAAPLACAHTPFYVAADLGILQADFNTTYLDQSDIIHQNIAQTLQQHGYTEGLAVGYSSEFCNNYLLGGEFSGNFASHMASFQSGAATAAFSDNTQLNGHLDLVFVPGVLLGNGVSAYMKVGASYAWLQDSLSSPAGFTPVMQSYNSNKNALGFAAGLGFKKALSDQWNVFVEGNYHDYGTVTFSGFQNFTANYTHSAHVYTYSAVVGAGYFFS